MQRILHDGTDDDIGNDLFAVLKQTQLGRHALIYPPEYIARADIHLAFPPSARDTNW